MMRRDAIDNINMMWYNSTMDTIYGTVRVSVTQLKCNTADLLNRVCYGGARIIITSSGKERAALVSVGDLEQPSSLSHDELQEVIRRWLNDNFDGVTWERVCTALAGENGLLGALGIAFTPPDRWITEDIP